MIIFRYKNESGNNHQIIQRPVADISLQSSRGLWFEFHPYIDSGADITLVPLSLGKLLGFTKDSKKIEKISGISGSIPIIYLINEMKIGQYVFKAQIGWALTEDVPPLLGRKDVFDRFDITFKQAREEIVFDKISIKFIKGKGCLL